jgi:hypothetical protein
MFLGNRRVIEALMKIADPHDVWENLAHLADNDELPHHIDRFRSEAG